MHFEPHDAFKEKLDACDQQDKEQGPVDHKQKGNEAFKVGKYDEAIEHYDEAISLDARQAALYSNRAACWASKGEYAKALVDAEKCTAIDPKFIKAYARKGHALFNLNRLDEAEQAYIIGLKIDEANDGCKSGLKDCQALQEKRRKRSIKGKAMKIAGRMRASLERLTEFAKEMKFGKQIGLLLLCIGVLASTVYLFMLRTHGEGHPKDAAIKVMRRFRKIDGVYTLSYLEAGASSHMKLLLLHRTSLSAEAEFGGIIPELFAKAALPGGLKVVAPDRPCHGYSLCPETGEPVEPFTLFARLLSERPVAQKFAYMTSGYESARHALEIVQRRGQAAQVILLRPQMISPDTKGLTSSLAAAESMRWALLRGERPSTTEGTPETLPVGQLPKGCAVLLIYLRGDVEDPALKTVIEISNTDVSVEVLYLESFEDGLVSAVSNMFRGKSAAFAELEAEDDDEPVSLPWWRHLSPDKMKIAVTSLFGRARARIATMFSGAEEEEEW